MHRKLTTDQVVIRQMCDEIAVQNCVTAFIADFKHTLPTGQTLTAAVCTPLNTFSIVYSVRTA